MCVVYVCLCVCACALVHVCLHVCVHNCLCKKNDKLTHLFMRIFLVAHFPDLHYVVFYFLLGVPVQSSIFHGHYSFFVFFFIFNSNSPPPQPIFLLVMMRQIKQSATNQAMNKLGKTNRMKQIEQCVSNRDK